MSAHQFSDTVVCTAVLAELLALQDTSGITGVVCQSVQDDESLQPVLRQLPICQGMSWAACTTQAWRCGSATRSDHSTMHEQHAAAQQHPTLGTCGAPLQLQHSCPLHCRYMHVCAWSACFLHCMGALAHLADWSWMCAGKKL